MTTSAEEVLFTAGMEREHEPPEAQKPVWREVDIGVTRGLWRTHAMVHGVLEIVSRLAGRVRSLAERGPDPDYAETPYARGMRDGAKFAGSPNVGGVNGNSKVLTALVALNTALLIGISAWLLNTVSRHDRELAVVACQLNPQQCLQVNRGP